MDHCPHPIDVLCTETRNVSVLSILGRFPLGSNSHPDAYIHLHDYSIGMVSPLRNKLCEQYGDFQRSHHLDHLEPLHVLQ